MRTLKLTSSAAVLAAAFALSACGGDDNSLPETPVTTPDITSTTASGTSLISQGDDICAETNTAVGAAQAASTDAATELSQVADLYDGMVGQLGALPGAADDTSLQDTLNAGDDVVQAYKDAELSAQRGDDPTQAESDADSAYATFASAAQTYGFTECGGEPTAPSATVDGTDSTTPVVPVAPVETTPVPVTPVPVTPAPVPVTPAPVTPVDPGGGTGGGTPVAPPASGGGSSSGGVGPG